MAIQTVNVGTTPNDGTGDPARTAFIKVNDNFTATENAASKLVATNAQALAGTAGVLPDAAGVKAAFNQFGLGAPNALPNDADLNLIRTQGIYGVASNGVSNRPPGGLGSVIVVNYGLNNVRCSQVYVDIFSRIHLRSNSGSDWTPWVELHHTGNMQPDIADGLNSPRLMRNVSGANVNNEANTAGSGLRFCDFSTTGVLTASATAGAGTWKNISGTALSANEYGLFVRIA